MRILIADALPASVPERLADLGHDVAVDTDLTGDDLPGALAGVEALVVRSTRVTAEAIAAGGELRLVLRAGAGVNTIDTGAAAGRGVYVCNVPGENAIAVAELTMGLILALDRSIPDNVAEARAGRWDKQRFSKAQGLHGRTLGIVGCGDIGLAVAQRARAFGLRLLAVDRPGRDPERQERIAALGIEGVADLPALARTADILTFHVPAAPGTRHMVDAEFLGHVRPGTWIVNTSRSDIVDEDALLAAIDDKDLRVAVDVLDGEPSAKRAELDHPLARHERVYVTHHIGASTQQAQDAVADATVATLAEFARGNVRNCVNLETRTLGTTTLSVRHLDRVGVLSGVLRVLKEARINVEQMENRVFAGARAAVATLHVAGDVRDDTVAAMREVEHVLNVAVAPTRGEREPG